LSYKLEKIAKYVSAFLRTHSREEIETLSQSFTLAALKERIAMSAPAEARSPPPEMPAEATVKEPDRDRAESSGDIAQKSLRGRLFTKPILRDADPEEGVDKNPMMTPAGRL
jgi:hypothetical protein